MEVLDRLAQHAREMPERAAVESIGPDGHVARTLTYRDLHRVVVTSSASIEPGCVALLSCANGPEFVTAFLAVLAAGGTVFPVSAGLSAPELQRAAIESKATMALAESPASERLAGAGLRTVAPTDLLRHPEVPRADYSTRTGARLLLQSSGTTGLPRIASRSAASLDAVARNVARAVGLTPSDHVLAAIPMSHSYGVENALLAPIWAGACIHAIARVEPAALETRLREGGVTVFPGVAFMFELLGAMGAARQAADGADPAHCRTLRSAYSAGSPLPASVAARFTASWDVQIGQLYGATEIGSVTFNDPQEAGFDAECVGRAMGGVEIVVVDPAAPDPRRPAPTGDEGHVLVRAPSMLDGYINGQAPIVDGFFQTGDLGRLDGRGRLRITGRLKLLIDVGGIKVNPLEVEAVLTQHPDVKDCVVVPVRVTDTVSRLRALVTGKEGTVDVESLRAHARERLAVYKVPRIIEVRDNLPRSATGKILRRQIEEEVGA